jgi:hypothetical protein
MIRLVHCNNQCTGESGVKSALQRFQPYLPKQLRKPYLSLRQVPSKSPPPLASLDDAVPAQSFCAEISLYFS